MQHWFAFEAVNRTLQDICNCPQPFGGIPTVLGGDFLQTLLVVTYGTKSDILNVALIPSLLWPSIQPNFFTLEKNMHVGDDPKEQQYAHWLQELAKGALNDAEDTLHIPDYLHCMSNHLTSLIDHTYPNIKRCHGMEYFHECCILSPCNREANEINDYILNKFPGHAYDLWASDQAFNPDTETPSANSYTSEILHSTIPSGFPQAHLRLKIGCPIIVLHNMHSDRGICNGMRGIVTQITT